MANAPVVIASAAADARKSWAQELREAFVVYEVAELEALAQVTSNLKPGVLVLDLTLPGLGRIAGLQQVQRWSAMTKTLVLTDVESENEGISALKAGAKGYCSRAINTGSLGKAVTAISGGEMWVKRSLVPAIVARLVSLGASHAQVPTSGPDRRLACLTLRQREVAEAIARGASNKEIAFQLKVTERTVKSHLTEIFRTVGVLDRLHLALLLNNALASPFDVEEAKTIGPAHKNGSSVARQPVAGSE